MAEYAPRVANFFMTVPPFSSSVKWALDVAPERRLPLFAPRSFRRGFVESQKPEARSQKPGKDQSPAPERRTLSEPPNRRVEGRIPNPEPRVPSPGSRRVLLWPDCSNNYFHPEVAHAAVKVLEASGFSVAIPRERLCCGRPLYDHGMLTAARRRLAEILESLRGDIEAGTPIVGLEPSCVSVFRDELLRFFPDDPLARKLSQQALFLTEFLVRAGAVPALGMRGRAIVHPHCHERASLCLDDDLAVLKATGLDLTVLDAGCCGMAGAFGFERHHLGVSRAIGERVLLPAVRAAAPDTYVVTNGFSCREQITQLTGRRVWHVAELLAQGLGCSA
jgi:Fe-S oxidoreductase